MHTAEIKSTENGPNLIYLDCKVFTALSRCGGSSNEPFCDGTYPEIGFHAKPADLKCSPSIPRWKPGSQHSG